MLIHTQDTGNTIKAIAGDEYSKIVIGNDGKEQMRVCDLVGAFIEEGKKEGIEVGREEGRKETREEDIRKVVKMLRTLNYEDGSILENIMKVFDLSEENAREYLEESLESNKFQERLDDVNKQFKDIMDSLSN